MKLIEATSNKDWIHKNNIWLNKTVYFCKNRQKERVKWIKYIEVNCNICNEIMLQKKGNEIKYKRSYCSDDCRSKAINLYYAEQNHMSFTGGRYIHKGYILIKCKEHHRANKDGYVGEHILIAEKNIKRKLKANEIVHHKDKNRSNNNPCNLQIMLDSEHKSLHGKETIYKIDDEYLKKSILIDNKTFTEIANEIGCSSSLISQKARKIGVKSPYGNYK